jgi:hypothetical protein
MNDGRHINFTSKDRDLAELFKKCLGIKVKVGKKTRGTEPKRQYFVVQFGDVMFYKWLVSIGLASRKSRTIGALKIPKKYFFHFLRGEFDGDGCIYSLWDPYWPNSFRYYSSFCSGSLKFIRWLRKYINKYAGIRGFVDIRDKLCTLKYGKAETNVLFKKMFPSYSVPCLKRKADKAKFVFKTEKKNNKLKKK